MGANHLSLGRILNPKGLQKTLHLKLYIPVNATEVGIAQ